MMYKLYLISLYKVHGGHKYGQHLEHFHNDQDIEPPTGGPEQTEKPEITGKLNKQVFSSLEPENQREQSTESSYRKPISILPEKVEPVCVCKEDLWKWIKLFVI